MTDAPPLEVEGLAVAYGGRVVLAGVSLALAAGELVAVLGPNGAGKSSLVRALAGAIQPTAGRVRYGGRPSEEMPRRELARAVAVVPQGDEVSFGFRVREVVAMGRAPYQGAMQRAEPSDEGRVDDALARCDLVGLGERAVESLSGGERRRVVIARALCQAAPVLLLDEPAAHLDLGHIRSLFELLRAEVARRSLACLAVVHDPNVAARYADRVALVGGGGLRALGPAAEVLTEASLEATFGVGVERATSASGATVFVVR